MNELKHEIEEYLAKNYCCEFKEECKDGVRTRCSEYEEKLSPILKFVEPKVEERKKLCDDFENIKAGLESQIAQLGERCNQLLKDKGNLTDELDERTKDLLNANHRIEQMQDAKCTSCTELGGMQLKIDRLEQQIEKMKNCQNCDNTWNGMKLDICTDCKDHNKWKLRR